MLGASRWSNLNGFSHALDVEHVATTFLNDFGAGHVGIVLVVLILVSPPHSVAIELIYGVPILEALEATFELTFDNESCVSPHG